ncbi:MULTISPECIES: Crp/Fnr family transcriptional regulator [unclassified Sedimentibacter]|uniref:Crp/Fnr family transcriptional regulator n=1 Tax=unclassified Sedimentibacter TaxID=2649220 RepID=UPI0027DFC533|nr:Crp/Fnr family transcriptional regulator [Sedimentibacter sp. MB35-C1]WMJ76970.1 Crp/Fnr family transcriptional regulator [Sedimentibacter sp. MB35-C1]
MNHKLFALQKCTLFKNKSFDEIEALLLKINFREENIAENEIIFSPVQNANRIGILLSGAVDVQKIFPNGKVVIIERKRDSEVIGESSIFSKYEYYPDNICACKPTKVLFITKSDLLRLFALDSQFMLNFLESTSNSTLMLKHKIGILSLDSIQEKIAGYLVHYLQHESEDKNTNIVILPFSKKAWAEYMDVSRTSLSRELRKLEAQGILSFQKRTITVMDINRLSKIISL